MKQKFMKMWSYLTSLFMRIYLSQQKYVAVKIVMFALVFVVADKVGCQPEAWFPSGKVEVVKKLRGILGEEN